VRAVVIVARVHAVGVCVGIHVVARGAHRGTRPQNGAAERHEEPDDERNATPKNSEQDNRGDDGACHFRLPLPCVNTEARSTIRHGASLTQNAPPECHTS